MPIAHQALRTAQNTQTNELTNRGEHLGLHVVCGFTQELGDGVAQSTEGQLAVARANDAGNRARHLNFHRKSADLREFEHKWLGLPGRMKAMFDCAAD